MVFNRLLTTFVILFLKVLHIIIFLLFVNCFSVFCTCYFLMNPLLKYLIDFSLKIFVMYKTNNSLSFVILLQHQLIIIEVKSKMRINALLRLIDNIRNWLFALGNEEFDFLFVHSDKVLNTQPIHIIEENRKIITQ